MVDFFIPELWRPLSRFPPIIMVIAGTAASLQPKETRHRRSFRVSEFFKRWFHFWVRVLFYNYPTRVTVSWSTPRGASLPSISFLKGVMSPITSAIIWQQKNKMVRKITLVWVISRLCTKRASEKQTAAIVDGANIVLRLTFSDSETNLRLTFSHLPTCQRYRHTRTKTITTKKDHSRTADEKLEWRWNLMVVIFFFFGRN